MKPTRSGLLCPSPAGPTFPENMWVLPPPQLIFPTCTSSKDGSSGKEPHNPKQRRTEALGILNMKGKKEPLQAQRNMVGGLWGSSNIAEITLQAAVSPLHVPHPKASVLSCRCLIPLHLSFLPILTTYPHPPAFRHLETGHNLLIL